MSDGDLAIQRPVSFAMLDHTQHMNNSEYIRMIFDCLHERGFSTARPFTLEMNYAHESRLGDTLNLFLKQVDDSSFIQISNSRGVSITAKVTPLQ